MVHFADMTDEERIRRLEHKVAEIRKMLFGEGRGSAACAKRGLGYNVRSGFVECTCIAWIKHLLL